MRRAAPLARIARAPGVRYERSVRISDVHFGTRGCKSDLLPEFLERHECDHLYLAGDIIDGWQIRSGFWSEEQNAVVQAILRMSALGTRVTYVCGNHGECLRGYPGLELGGVSVVDEAVLVTADGRRILVLHGDRFDVCVRNARWLAVSFVQSFEGAVLAEARQRGLDGVVCGHVHHASVREEDGVTYYNDGDWVESCTALVEDEEGGMRLVRWLEERERARPAESLPAAG